MDEELVAELDKGLDGKKAQVEKAEEKLAIKKRKNQRVRDRKSKLRQKVVKAEQLIEEHERAIEYQNEQIEIFKAKLARIPEEEDFAQEVLARDEFVKQLKKMTEIRWDIYSTLESFEKRELDDFVVDIYWKQIKKQVAEFKRLKGRGI